MPVSRVDLLKLRPILTVRLIKSIQKFTFFFLSRFNKIIYMGVFTSLLFFFSFHANLFSV